MTVENLVMDRLLREPRIVKDRSVFIVVEGDIARFGIVNMSPHGVAGHCDRDLFVGQHASFQFENGACSVGQVRWVNDGKVGIYFPRALPSSIVDGFDERRDLTPRPPRYAATRRAMIKVASFQSAVTIRNVSSGGMMIETSLALNLHQVVTIVFSEVVFVASVRWTAGNLAGIKLRDVLDLTMFVEMSHPGPPSLAGGR